MKRQESKDGVREIVLDDGTIRYEARVNRRGERPLSKRFKSRKDALAWKRSIDADIDRGKPVVNAKTVLVRTAIDDYLKHREKSRNPLPSNQITEYERAKLDLGDFAIGKLDRSDIERWLHLLLKTSRGKYKNGKDRGPYAPASVRKFYYCFKSAVDWHSAERRYHVSEFLFKLPKGAIPGAWEGKRDRRLAQGEEETLYAAGIGRKNTYSRADWEAIIGFALATAMREQELVFARWQDLRQNGYKLFVPKEHCKTATDRMVLLSGKARAIIETQRSACPEREPRIFYQIPNPDSLCDAFARLTARAKVEDLTFHDLRHEATSRLCESGKLSQMQLMEMTGHSSMSTFKGYLHLLSHENSVTLE